MKVYVGAWEYDEPVLFATYELADAYAESSLRRWFHEDVLNPKVDIPRMGGVGWRVPYYTEMGYDAFLAQRRAGLGAGPWVTEWDVLEALPASSNAPSAVSGDSSASIDPAASADSRSE